MSLRVTNPSEEEFYNSVKAAAERQGATFLGPAPTYKYGRFLLADGQEIEMHLYHVLAGKWPANLERFKARQARSRSRATGRMLTRLQELANEGGAQLMDTSWHGPHYWYSFKLPDERCVSIRGSKLMATGWPADVDAYLKWSAARRQPGSGVKTKDALYLEFKTTVALNHAVVLTPEWLGSRKAHEVLLSDGTVRWLKPNQLKYFGWPLVPLDELRLLAAPYPVHLIPDADAAGQLFRIMVSGEVYLEGGFAELKAQWVEGVPALICETTQEAEKAGLRMLPAKWLGVLAEYEFVDAKGAVVCRQLPAAQAFEAKRLEAAELAKLRRVGTMHGVVLLSTKFEGPDAAYDWRRGGAMVRATSRQLIQASKDQVKLETLKARVKDLGLDAELLSTAWAGMCAPYLWRMADGHEVTAKLSQLRLLTNTLVRKHATGTARLSRSKETKVFQTGASEKSLEILRDWADGVGLRLLSTDWVNPGASYEWALPDGTVVVASLKKVRNCTRAILRHREGAADDLPVAVMLTPDDCSTLKDRIALSKSR